MTTILPNAEELLRVLAERIRGAVRSNTALIGIHTGGVWLAERLHADLGLDLPLGSLDVSFYRDDFEQRGLRPQVRPSTIPFEVDGRDLILVDDVLYTGRTIRAAMNELFDYGRPASIRLAALVDRGGRELPIAPQFVGARVEVASDQNIELERDARGQLSLKLSENTKPAGH
jgi:pyrimidine operon attenuation protein/uracil phosphoribosyltransferase